VDKLSRKKIDKLLDRIGIIEKRIRNLLKECVITNNETLVFWTQKQKELRWEYDSLKTVYAMILKYVITKEYWAKYNQQAKRIKKLKSIDVTVNSDNKKSLVHKRTIQTIFNNAYNSYVASIDMGYKKKMALLSNIQLVIIKVNRMKNEDENSY
jgi:hypothetical protein